MAIGILATMLLTSTGYSKCGYKYKKVTKIRVIKPPRNTLSVTASHKLTKAGDKLELDYRPELGILYQRHIKKVVVSGMVTLNSRYSVGVGVSF
jgi:hypothetical protein